VCLDDEIRYSEQLKRVAFDLQRQREQGPDLPKSRAIRASRASGECSHGVEGYARTGSKQAQALGVRDRRWSCWARIINMPDWQLMSARLTIFVTPDTEVPSTLWRDTVGEDPETSIVQRMIAVRTETGPFAAGTLTLIVQPTRLDWNYEGLPSDVPIALKIGPYPDALRPFLDFCHRCGTAAWFPSTTRIALGLVLTVPTENRQTGYHELSQYIDGVPDDPEARDFQYQVNLPRAARVGIDRLEINRLSKWSVGSIRATASNSIAGTTAVILSHFHLRLELDISTNWEFQDLIPRESIDGVLDDLAAAANEVVERGARPHE
jgi:hypothetical protein